jgi:hypothetical protein
MDLNLSVTYSMLKSFPLQGSFSHENMVTTMAARLEQSIKSQMEGVL